MVKAVKTMRNRTGGKIAEDRLIETVKAARKLSPRSDGSSEESINEIRRPYVKESTPIGSMPPPASLKQGAAMLTKGLQGKDLTVLIDKLSERLAFEIAGVRLYDALIAKCKLSGDRPGGLKIDDLEHLREEEHEHLLLLKEVIEKLGGDPTFLSPSADVAGVASSGIFKIVTDTRTTMLQALDAMLVAELTDNDGWALLIDICVAMGFTEIAHRFQKALAEEEDHLDKVRTWLSNGLLPVLTKEKTFKKESKRMQARPARSRSAGTSRKSAKAGPKKSSRATAAARSASRAKRNKSKGGMIKTKKR